MKIYFIGQKGIPSKSGGVEKHVEELSTRLAMAGHEVYAYTRPNYTPKEMKVYKKVNLISLPSIDSKYLDAISHTFRACLDLVRRDVDIIHFHSIGPSSLIWLVKILKPGVPIVSTFHTRCYMHKKWGFFAKSYLRFGEFVLCKFSDRTVAVSKSLAAYVKEKYNSSAVYVPNGVSLPVGHKTDEIKKWGLKKNGYIVAISRLVRHKGIHYLIDAYNRLNTNKKLVIVGDGAFTDDYVQEIKKAAADNENIIFTGRQAGKALHELFDNAYLFVQPSESEGLSVALLEAMSFEKAVLVSNIPENLEAIGEVGFTFMDRNIDDLKDKLDFLLKRPRMVYENGKLGRIRVAQHYSWSNIAKNIIKIYKQAILEKGNSVRPLNSFAKRFINFF